LNILSKQTQNLNLNPNTQLATRDSHLSTAKQTNVACFVCHTADYN